MERGTTNHADRTDIFVLRISENKRQLAGLRAALWGWKLLVGSWKSKFTTKAPRARSG